MNRRELLIASAAAGLGLAFSGLHTRGAEAAPGAAPVADRSRSPKEVIRRRRRTPPPIPKDDGEEPILAAVPMEDDEPPAMAILVKPMPKDEGIEPGLPP